MCITASRRRHGSGLGPRQTWRGFGARTEEEAYGYWVQQFRRLMGVTIVREFARLRIRRVPFLGVPREFVRDRARGRRVVQRSGGAGPWSSRW